MKSGLLFRGLYLIFILLFLFHLQFFILSHLSTVNCQFSIGSASAQNSLIPSFQRNQNILVMNGNDSLSLAWAGGMNSVAFFNFDFNLDGNDDLLGFEKNGNRLLPFVQQNNHWHYAPEYTRFFPELHDWVIFKDYDNDGKKDIFTYGLAGIRVFKNNSQEQLSFSLVTEQLTSFYYTDYSNIYASPNDNLAIADVDHDGDLDILNFWVLGKYIHLQKNYAVENNLANGWLDFRLEDECWGKFSEGTDNNEITLLSYCQDKNEKPTRHVGSTMSIMDYNHDGLDDLILGDIDFAQVILLTNGGTQQEALMVSQTTDFPNAANPVNLYSMPLVSPVDLNADGQQELLVSPADPALSKSQNINSVWLYEYDSLLQNHCLTTTSYLQQDMIDLGSGCYPVFYDWNGDGLLDLFAGNYGYYDSSSYINGSLNSYYSSAIAYFENIGTSIEPSFQLVNSDFGNMRQLNKQALYPAFADLDGDGQSEMICGCIDGTLILWKNNQITANFLNIDVGDYATPQLFDLDQDGKMDLLIGNRRGVIAYYRNVSTSNNIDFQLENSSVGNVDVRDYELSYFGFATPCFYRQNNETRLICGNEQGKLFFYDNIDNNLNGSFTLQSQYLAEKIDNQYFTIKEGIRIGVAIAYLDGSQFPDMIVGNFAGGMSYFEGLPEIPVSIEPVDMTADIHCYPNPTSDFIHIETKHEGDKQIQVFDAAGRIILESSFYDNHFELDISHLNPAVYLLKIFNEAKSSVYKIIKK